MRLRGWKGGDAGLSALLATQVMITFVAVPLGEHRQVLDSRITTKGSVLSHSSPRLPIITTAASQNT